MKVSISGIEHELKPLAALDKWALLQEYTTHQKKPAALNRIRMAALGLGLDLDGMPKFDDYEFDLIKYGNAIALHLAKEPKQIDLFTAGERFLAEMFASLAPTEQQVKQAENF